MIIFFSALLAALMIVEPMRWFGVLVIVIVLCALFYASKKHKMTFAQEYMKHKWIWRVVLFVSYGWILCAPLLLNSEVEVPLQSDLDKANLKGYVKQVTTRTYEIIDKNGTYKYGDLIGEVTRECYNTLGAITNECRTDNKYNMLEEKTYNYTADGVWRTDYIGDKIYKIYLTKKEGKIVKEERYDKNWNLLSYTNYEYKKNALIKSETFRAKGEKNAEEQYRYKKGKCIEKKCMHILNSESAYAWGYKYALRAAGHNTGDDDIEMLEEYHYTYNEEGIMQSETHYLSYPKLLKDKRPNDYIVITTMNEHGDIYRREIGGEFDGYWTYEYDSQNNWIEKCYHTSDGTPTSIIIREIEYYYN